MSRSDRIQHISGLEEAFYNKPLYISYSSLSTLLYSPKLFYNKYVLGNRKDHMSDGALEGKIVHALMDEKNFDKNFVISPTKLPSEPTKSLLDKIFQNTREDKCMDGDVERDCNLADRYNSILIGLKEIDLHQNLKTDVQRIDKIITESNISYYEFLKTKEGKDVIDQDMLNRCKEDADILKNHKKIADLLKLNNTDENIEVYNEKTFQVPLDDFPFGLKGIIDNKVIDHKNKIVNINDLKTTGKTISDFEETIKYYRYDLQAAIYSLAIQKLYPQYNFEFTFIVIDKYQQAYPFLVSKITMGKWLMNLKEALTIAKYHYETRKFLLPHRFEIETVII